MKTSTGYWASSKVLFSIFKYLSPLERVSIKIYKKLFEYLVKPVLMYNSKIWYMDFHENISNAFNRTKNNDLNILREKRHPLIKDYFHH
jgi:hypothetical protein